MVVFHALFSNTNQQEGSLIGIALPLITFSILLSWCGGFIQLSERVGPGPSLAEEPRGKRNVWEKEYVRKNVDLFLFNADE